MNFFADVLFHVVVDAAEQGSQVTPAAPIDTHNQHTHMYTTQPTLKQLSVINNVMIAYQAMHRKEDHMTISTITVDIGDGGVEAFVITEPSPEEHGSATFKIEFIRVGSRESNMWAYRLACWGAEFEGSINGIFTV